MLPVCSESKKAAQELINEGSDKLTAEIKKYRKSRSLNANAYFHLLVNKLARAVGTSDEELKKRLVEDYGAVEVGEDGAAAWFMCSPKVNPDSIHKYNRLLRSGKIEGKEYNCYLIYKETHRYDSKEMAELIDGVVSECKEVGIQTETPEQIANMISQWKGAEA